MPNPSHIDNNLLPPPTNLAQAPLLPLIPQSQPQPQRQPQQPSTKKRRTSNAGSGSGSGSRGVANLNPDQLAKKRANDREAQRAIRERTKGQIEGLERRIQELIAQKPYQELQHAVRQKEIVEAENEEIKRRLISIQGLIQPLLNPACSNGPTPPSNNISLSGPPAYPCTNPAQLTVPPSVSAFSDSTSIRSTTSSNPTHASPPQGPMPTTSIPPSNFPPQSAAGCPPISCNFGPRQSNAQMPRDDKLALDYLMASRHNSRDSQQSGGRRGRTASTTSNTPLPMETLAPAGRSPSIDDLDPRSDSFPAYAVPVKNIPPTCPLDGLLLDFLADRRKQALDGIPSSELVGPAYPSFLSLVNPQRKTFSHPLSKMFTDMMSTFPDISTLPEQVAILYVMFLVMRWQIAPTQENSDRLPEWITPRPSQLFVPHPAWIDYLPWPRMRDKLVQIYPSTPFDEFFVPYTRTVSLNWPWGDVKSVLVNVPGSEEYGISESFEAHLRDLGNWSLGPRFATAHPGLKETCRIREEGKRAT